jgi:hypothetical protein
MGQFGSNGIGYSLKRDKRVEHSYANLIPQFSPGPGLEWTPTSKYGGDFIRPPLERENSIELREPVERPTLGTPIAMGVISN